MAPPADRLAMTNLAAAYAKETAMIRFEVDDLELHRRGPSYTIDTIDEMNRRGEAELWWLIGADMLNYLPKWHRVSELVRRCQFLILARPNVPLRWGDLPAELRQRLEGNVVEAPLLDISSSQIRQRLRDGLAIDALTPPPVAEYINHHGLYRSQIGETGSNRGK